jgi:dipeptidyl aminopeptidase/acylaminoacyl peptidase
VAEEESSMTMIVKPDVSIDQLVDTPWPAHPRISPDGRRVVFEYGPFNKPDKDTPHQRALWLLDVATGETRVLTGSNGGTHDSAVWSPDGTRLAFVSNRVNLQEKQLYLLEMAGGDARRLTDLRGSVADPLWTPDGGGLLFLYDGTLDPEAPPERDPIVEDENPRFNCVWRYDLASGAVTPLTPDTHHVHEYALSPDGKRLALVASTHPNPWQGWYSAQLYTQAVDGGALRPVCTLSKQLGRLTWSPDSAQVAYVSGTMSDEGNVAGDVYVVSGDGGEPRPLTPGIDHSITWIDWRDNGILYGGRDVDSVVHGWIDPDSGALTTIVKGLYSVNGWGPESVSVADDGTFVAARESFTEPPNVWACSLASGEWRQLTHFSPDRATFPPLRAESRSWTSADGTPVQGYLLLPDDYQPGQRYPLFLHVHGGPSLSYLPRFGSAWERLMLARGCVVLMPNPRGSWGRGCAYQAANVGDLGGGDWQDIMAGVDMLIDEGMVDPERLAIGGWSYGGYLVTWAVTQTDRFRCAFAGASITNYESNYGVVKNREWQSTMFGSVVYDDVERHRARSPMTHVRNVKTPTLLVHGMEDVVAPPQQSIEFYTALQYLGVPSKLVLYPREPHGFQERAHQKDMFERLAGWMDQYLFRTED